MVVVVALVVALIAAVLLDATSDSHSIRLLQGEVQRVDVDGIGIAINGEGYLVGTGRAWQGLDGSWRESGQPECLPPDSRGAVVELGILPIADEDGAGGQPNNVAWVRCLRLPSEIGIVDEDPPSLDHAYRQALDSEG